MNKNMPVALGWLFALIVVGGFAATSMLAIQRRRKAGLPTQAISVWARQGRARSRCSCCVAVYLLNQERQRPAAPIVIQGVPWVVPLVARARRRADVPADADRVRPPRLRRRRQRRGRAPRRHQRGRTSRRSASSSAPRWRSSRASCSPRATTPSRPTTGGAQTLLYAVGAAVIGGTSLFGGRGKVYDAVTGGLVVAIIANGLPLVTQKSGIQFIINGLVLLLAASVDAISRRRAAATGR